MYKKEWCTCRVAILLIKPIQLFWRFCCRRRRSFARSLFSDLSERRSFKTFRLWTSYSIAWENRSVHGLGEWYAKSRTVNFFPESCLPFSQISSFYRKRSRKPGTGIKDGFQRMVLEFLLGIFHPEKQDYFYRCSVVSVNFPLRLKKACCTYFPTGFFC